MVGRQQARQRVEVVRRLRDHAARRRHVRRVQRGEPGIPAEDPEDADALVRAERRPLAVDRLLRPGDRGREADAVLGPLDVVVHRLGDGHQGDARVGQDLRVGQRVVATDRHEDIDPERRQVVEDERGQVEQVLADGVPGSIAAGSQGGSALARILRGLVRDVWRIVPPVRSIVRVLIRSSGRR